MADRDHSSGARARSAQLFETLSDYANYTAIEGHCRSATAHLPWHEQRGLGMSDKGTDSSLGGYIAVALFAGAMVYYFTKPSAPPTIATVAATAAPSDSAPYLPLPAVPVAGATPALAPPVALAHRYDAKEGTTYYYSASVSEEQKKTGKQAPDMLGFWYLGKNNTGNDVVALIENNAIRDLANCSRPCTIIHKANGATIAFDGDSIIGAVFSDAQKGFLREHQFPKPKPIPAPATDSYQSQPAPVYPDPSPSATGE